MFFFCLLTVISWCPFYESFHCNHTRKLFVSDHLNYSDLWPESWRTRLALFDWHSIDWMLNSWISISIKGWDLEWKVRYSFHLSSYLFWKGKIECFTMWIRIIDDSVKTNTDPSSKLGTCCLSRITREYLYLPSVFVYALLFDRAYSFFLLIEYSWTYFDRSASTSVGWLVSLSRFIYQLRVCVCVLDFFILFSCLSLSLSRFMYESIYA